MSGAQTTDVLYYDGACGMCRCTAHLLRAIDWLGRLSFQDMVAVEDHDLPVPRARAMEGIPMRTRQGRALVGFPALRRALRQTPFGFLPACIMYVPGAAQLGAIMYRSVATHRRRGQACALAGDQR